MSDCYDYYTARLAVWTAPTLDAQFAAEDAAAEIEAQCWDTVDGFDPVVIDTAARLAANT